MLTFEQYEPMIHKICSKFGWSHVEYDDLYQQGALGLLEALERYEPREGKRPITYLYPYVYWKVSECVSPQAQRRLYNRGKTVRFTDKELGAVTVDASPNVDNLDALQALYERVSDKDQAILERLSKGVKPTEVAKQVGCTRQNVHLVLRRLKKIAEDLEESDYL